MSFFQDKTAQAKFVFNFLKEQYSLYRQNAEIQKKFNCIIEPNARFQYDDINNIYIGSNVRFSTNCSVLVMDLVKERKDGKLEIGDHSAIGEGCNIRAAGGKIIIGKNCLLAQQVHIIAANHLIDKSIPIIENDWDRKNNYVLVGDGCWLGCQTVLLPGSEIGEGAIVAAGAVVTGKVDPYSIWGGVPAKKIRDRV